MKTVELFSVTGVLLALALLSQPAVANNEFLICCEGQLCNGGGAYAYEYMLLNNSTTAVTLTEFFVGTMDPNIVNYTFFLPAGFTATIILNDGFPPCNVTYTSLVPTPHGGLMPPTGPASARVIYWSGSATIQPQGTITFAYTNTHLPIDQEWFAKAAGSWTIPISNSPIAGPLGVYTNGWVHGPGFDPVPVQATTWGAIKSIYR